MDAITVTAREQALLLGKRKSLVGILTPGQGVPDDAERPCVLILNAGIIHRVGPNRLHVETARALAAAGYTSLRFDLSGIGDSDKRADALPPLDATLADIREVADWLQAKRNVTQLVLVGLCSGADHGLIYAGSDPRVLGLVLLDPSIPRTPQHYVRYYGSRAFRLRSWANAGRALARKLGRFAGALKREQIPAEAVSETSIDSKEVRSFLKNAYRRAVDQGVAFLAVFTADRDSHYNYRKQMLDALDGVEFGEQLQLEFFSASDHTFASELERANLVKLIVKWIQVQSFNAVPTSEASKPPIVQVTTALTLALALLCPEIGSGA